MRKEPLVTGEYYHIYNRGVDKRDIISDFRDLERFKESIRHFNQTEGIGSLRQHDQLNRLNRALDSEPDPLVAIVAICINPNHFHLFLKQLVDGGISKYLQKTLGGYTYYFNTKNGRSGSLFEGTFKSKLIDNDNYFRKIFGYVNQNNLVHDIPKSKLHLVFNSALEYEKELFDLVDPSEGDEMLKIFGGKNGLREHCKEIISIIRKDRGQTSLDEVDNLP